MNRKCHFLYPLLFALALFSCRSNDSGNNRSESGSATAQQENLETGPDCIECGPSETPDSLTTAISIADANEPGQRLILNGRVFYAGTRTPAPDVLLYVYHTNAKGKYPKRGNETGQAKWHGYLRGWLRTDASGHYLISTIKPGAYPGRIDPAHIHVIAKQGNQPAYYLNDFIFEGDSLLTPQYREKISKDGDPGIVSLSANTGGMLTGYRDIMLKK